MEKAVVRKPINTQIMPAGPGWRAVVKDDGGKVTVMPLLGWFMSVEPKPEAAAGNVLFMIGIVAIGPMVILVSDLTGFVSYLAPGEKLDRKNFK